MITTILAVVTLVLVFLLFSAVGFHANEIKRLEAIIVEMDDRNLTAHTNSSNCHKTWLKGFEEQTKANVMIGNYLTDIYTRMGVDIIKEVETKKPVKDGNVLYAFGKKPDDEE